MSTTTTESITLAVDDVLARFDNPERIARSVLRRAPDTPAAALEAMEKEAGAGGLFFATSYVVSAVKTFGGAVTGISDWIAEAEALRTDLGARLRPEAVAGNTEMASDVDPASYGDLVGREVAEQEARDIRAGLARLDEQLRRASRLLAVATQASALVAVAGRDVALSIKVANAVRRVHAIRDELPRLRATFDGNGELDALVAAAEQRLGRKLPSAPAVTWTPWKITEPSLRSETP